MKELKRIIEIDKKLYKDVFIYTFALFVSVYLIGRVSAFFMGIFTSKLAAITGVQDFSQITVEQAGLIAPTISKYLWMMILTAIVFAVAHLYNYSFFEGKIWNRIFNKKTTLKSTNKFLALNILLGTILSFIVGVIFVAISGLSDAWVQAGAWFYLFSVLLAIYILFVGYISYGRTHEVLKSVKNAFVIGLGALHITIIPLVIAVLISLVLNLILGLVDWLPSEVLIALQGALLIAYLSWFSIYLTNTLKSVKF